MGKRRSVPRRLWALAYGQTELIGSIIFACSVNEVRSQVCKGVGNKVLISRRVQGAIEFMRQDAGAVRPSL